MWPLAFAILYILGSLLWFFLLSSVSVKIDDLNINVTTINLISFILALTWPASITLILIVNLCSN